MSTIRPQVDTKKCTHPTECRACLERCPGGVFLVYPSTARRPGREAADWRVAPVFTGRCTGCLACVDSCPTNAITLPGV